MLSDFHPTVSGLAIEDILAYWVLALNLLVHLQVRITGIKYMYTVQYSTVWYGW